MGNFLNMFKKKETYQTSLLEPLNTEDTNNIIFNHIITIKNQITILESTTQSSIKNIATDMNHFNTRFDAIIKRLEYLEQQYIQNNNNQSIYLEPQ
jgi:hypothetical protein